MGGYAWVTLATNDSYSLGALVLAHSLKKAKTVHKLMVLITPAVSQPMREQLQTVFDVVKVVDVLDSKDEAHLALMQRPELGITFTKIHCWRMTEFDKCVFLDADTLVVRNCDELFEREEFSAAPDVSWPDCFNSGVFVYKPSVETFNKLLQFAVEKGSFDGGDQGLLNQFFSDWATQDIKKHLPFVYNLTSVAAYSYVPAFKHYGAETRIVHFIGTGKPWLQQLDPSTRTITPTAGSEHLTPLLQQWWDLFCEKVHPALNKNLDSNYDGMSHPPAEACSNTVPIALTDDSQTPRLIEPCTPYREQNDFRQHNLPYQPFDVKGSSGELLNVEFLLASVVQPTPEAECSDEQQRRESEWIGEKNGRDSEIIERNENEKTENERDETQDRRENERLEINLSRNEHYTAKEGVTECEKAEDDVGKSENEREQQQQECQQNQPEESERPTDPFNFNQFFPDETCINNYLEQNVITYQPYDNNTHHHHHRQNSNQYNQSQHEDIKNDNENHICCNSEINHQPLHENSSEIIVNQSDSQPQEKSPPLPRFLTIPENDKRQSGNTEAPKSKEPEIQNRSPATDASIEESEEETQQVQQVQEKRELTKSKSMSYLFDVTEMPQSRSVWKSQPDVNVESNRKYSMPKLKPILPRQNSFSKSVPSIIPKVTLYTEFFMSAEYKDPADLPKDKVGFVETLIRKGQLRRSKSAADISDRFGPLPDVSPEVEQPIVLRKTPLRHLDNELYDLSQCKRQIGNRPKVNAERRKENLHSLPALKPLLPQKEKKSSLVRKRKSKELSPNDSGKEKILKREPRKPKERKRETKIVPRNVSEDCNRNNVDEILKKLREFSKNYQHFFEVPQRSNNIRYKNANVQADNLLETQDVYEISEGFLRKSAFAPTAKSSKETQTLQEEKSDRQSSAVDSDFRQFRTYVQEKSKTSQKGLLSIQDLISKSEKDMAEGAKVLTETVDSCYDLKRKKDKVMKKKVDNLIENEIVQRKVNIKNAEKASECNNTDPRNFSEESKTAESRQNNLPEIPTPTDDNIGAENSKTLQEGISHSKTKAERTESSKPGEPKPSERSKNIPDDFSETANLPVVNGGHSVSENQITTSDHEGGKSVDEERHPAESGDVISDSKSSIVSKSETPNNVSTAKTSEHCEKKSPRENNRVEPFSKTVENDNSKSTGAQSENKYLTDKLSVGEDAIAPVTMQMLSSPSKALIEESKVNGEGEKEKSEIVESNKVDEELMENKKRKKRGNELGEKMEKEQKKGEEREREQNIGEKMEKEKKLRKKMEKEQKKGEEREIEQKKREERETEQKIGEEKEKENELEEKMEIENEFEEKMGKEKKMEKEQRKEEEKVKIKETEGQNEKRKTKEKIQRTERELGEERVKEKETKNGKKKGEEKEKKKEGDKEDVTEKLNKKPEEILCVPDFDTPRSSRVILPTSNHAGLPTTEALEETITKTVSDKSLSEAPRRSKVRKNRKQASTAAHALSNGNTSPKSSPDAPSPSSPSSSSSSPPYATPNGSAMPPNQEEPVSRSGIAGAIAQLSLDANSAQSAESAASAAHQEYLRRQNWETGKMDYMGRDSFDNIWSKICQTLEGEKELEEGSTIAAPAAVSPKPSTESSNSSSVIPTEEKETGKIEKPATVTPLVTPTTTPAAEPTGPSTEIPAGTLSATPPVPPSETPAAVPVVAPTGITASALSDAPSAVPTATSTATSAAVPTTTPTVTSSEIPTAAPTGITASAPAPALSDAPLAVPAGASTRTPVAAPTETPTATSAAVPTITPTEASSEIPTVTPTGITASVPTPELSDAPSAVPTGTPTGTPVAAPTATPTPTSVCVTTPCSVTTPMMSATTPAATPSEVPAAVPGVTPSALPAGTLMKTTSAMPPSVPPTDIQKCPEYMDTLPGDAAAGPVEDDEIIFSNTDKKQAGLTNITEEEGAGTNSSAKSGTVKLSDILQPKDGAQIDTVPMSGVASVKEAKTTEEAKAPDAALEGKKSGECKTVAICQPSQSPSEMPTKEEANASVKDGKSGTETKPEVCTTVAIPSPPIVFPGTPFGEKDKGEMAEEKKSEPIPLPPPETPPAVAPEGAPLTLEEDSKSDSSKDEGKQKKGVFTKILEMVGVAPKEKTEAEISKSVFYDVEGAVPSKQDPAIGGIEIAEPAIQASDMELKSETAIEAKEDPVKKPDEAGKAAAAAPPNVEEPTDEVKKNEVSVTPLPPKQTTDAAAAPKDGAKEADKTPEFQKKAKSNEKTKPPIEKPVRSVSPKEQTRPTTDTIQAPPSKSKSPSPKLTLPQTPPATAVTTPTPPPHSDLPPIKNSALLKVDETIPETPPVPQPSKETAEETTKGKILSEVDDIIGKAKSEVESRLQDRRSAEKEPTESADLINTMKMMVGDQAAQQPPTPEVEELRVTTEEDRLRHKGEVPSSKLSDQILKAIPPPRRKAISESASASAPSSAIPSQPSASPSPSSTPASPPQQKASKGSKPSSIPVPPPRSRGKPQQTTPTPTPSKGKSKK